MLNVLNKLNYIIITVKADDKYLECSRSRKLIIDFTNIEDSDEDEEDDVVDNENWKKIHNFINSCFMMLA